MRVYLDNSATTCPCGAAVSAIETALTEGWYNPSALYAPAMGVERQMRAVREGCLSAAGAAGQRLVFTSGGTEADNLAIVGHMQTEKKPGQVLMLSVEHPAVLQCAQSLTRLGHTVQEIPVRRDGLADLDWLAQHLQPETRLICLMQVNNETGAIQPIDEVVRLRDRLCPEAAIHVDGVQGFLRVPVDFNKRGIQSYAFSGHKVHAVKGIGGLITRRDYRLSPLLRGGGQEADLRSGTENTPGIAALGAAVKAWPADAISRLAALKRQLWAGLREAVPGAAINGPDIDSPEAAPHILNVSLPPARSQPMLNALEGEGVYVSAGSACGSHKQKTSPVLAAMGVPPALADCALRFSLCPDNTAEEIAYTVEAVRRQWSLLARYVRR